MSTTPCSKAFFVPDALREHVESSERQIAEIEAALAEADDGDFASANDVAALAGKWSASS